MSNKKPVILVIEDDPFLYRALTTVFTKEGYKVVTAHDGLEGVEKAKTEKPDIILLDLLLPLKNGFEVLEDLSKDEELKKIPVIVLSVLSQSADIVRAKQLGAKDYLVKPHVSMREVINKVREYLKAGA